MEYFDSESLSNEHHPSTKSPSANNAEVYAHTPSSVESNNATEVSFPSEAHTTVETQTTTPNDRGNIQDGEVAEAESINSKQANDGPFPGELCYEPPNITAEVAALLVNPPSDCDQQLVYRFLALASNHLEINSITNENAVQNTCSMYNYLLDSVKELKGKDDECNELLYAIGVLKHNISTGKGISAQLVRQWARQMVNAIKTSEQSS